MNPSPPPDSSSSPGTGHRAVVFTPEPPWTVRHRQLLLALGITSLLGLAGAVFFFSGSGAAPASRGQNVSSLPAGESPGSGPDHAPSSKTPQTSPESPVDALHQPYTASPHYPAALSIAGMEENSTRHEALEALMETWVSVNPRQAADWAGSLPAGVFRDEALSSLMFHWGARDPETAALWITRTGVDDPESVSVLAGHWSRLDPAKAAAWAQTLPNLDSRRDALASVAGAWATQAPQDAADWASRLPSAERTAAIANVLAAWADSSPAAAAAWLAGTRFDTPEEHATALAALVTPWTSQSPAAVSRFLNTLPEGPAREAAASQFAVTAAGTAPAEALMWAMNLADPEQRNQVVADACESWFEESPDTFHAGLPEALSLMEDAAMRKGVYEMLYERDPGFHDSLLQLADQPPADPVPPAAPNNGAARSPGPAPDASLLLPDEFSGN